MGKGNVVVAVHVRPLLPQEHGCTLAVGGDGAGQPVLPAALEDAGAPGREGDDVEHLWVKGYDRSFGFDHCIVSHPTAQAAENQQAAVYEKVGRELTRHTLDGFNTCILAYGQTGSGKTYTMLGGGGSASEGVIPRVCRDLLSQVQPDGARCAVEVSFFEIYNEKVTCLLEAGGLGPHSPGVMVDDRPPRSNSGMSGSYLKVREHPVTGPYVESLTKVAVRSYAEVVPLIQRGMRSRTVAETKYNLHSSRSHAVFTLTVTRDGGRVSHMNLVDLAGSERISSSHKDSTTKDGININKSLSALGRVIQSLADLSTAAKRASTGARPRLSSGGVPVPNHVSYRDSVLTWLLKENLGGNSKTTMIACVSPSEKHFEETLNTLRYADNVKKIRNCPRRAKAPPPQGLPYPYAGAVAGAAEGGSARTKVGAYPLLVSLDPHMTADDVLCWQLLPGETHVTTLPPQHDGSGSSSDDDSDLRYIVLDDTVNVCDPHCLFTTTLEADGSFHVTLTPALGTVTFVDGALLTTPVLLQHASRVIFGSSHCYHFLDPVHTGRQRRAEAPRQRVPKVLDWGYAVDEFAEVMQCNRSYEEVIKLQDEIDYWRGLQEGGVDDNVAAVRGPCLILVSDPVYHPPGAHQPKAGLVYPLAEGRNRVSAETWGLQDLCDGHHFYLEVVRGQVYKARKAPDDPLEPVWHGMKIAVKNSQFLVSCPLAPLDEEDTEAGEGYESQVYARRDGAGVVFHDESLEDLVHGVMNVQYQMLAMHDSLYSLPLELVDKDELEGEEVGPLARYCAADPSLQDILAFKRSLKDFTLMETPAKDVTPHQVNDFLQHLSLALRTLTHQFCHRLDNPPPKPFESRVTCEDLVEDKARWRARAEQAELEVGRLRRQLAQCEEGGAPAPAPAAATAPQVAALREEITALQEKLKASEAEVDRLVAEAVLGDEGKGDEGLSFLPDPEEDIRKFEMQRALRDKDAEIAEMRRAHDTAAAAHAREMEDARSTNAEVTRLLDDAHAALEAAQAECTQHKGDVTALREELAQQQELLGDESSAALDREIATLTSQLMDMQSELAGLREGNVALVAKGESAQHDAAAARKELALLVEQHQALQDERDEEAARAAATLAAAKKRTDEVEVQRVTLRDEVLLLEGKLRHAERELAAAQAKARPVHDAGSELNQSEHSIDPAPRSPTPQTTATAASPAASTLASERGLQERVAELTEANRQLKKENKKLKQHVLEQKLVNKTLTSRQPSQAPLSARGLSSTGAAPTGPPTPSKAVRRSESQGSHASRKSSGGERPAAPPGAPVPHGAAGGGRTPRQSMSSLATPRMSSVAGGRPPTRANSVGRDHVSRLPARYVPHSATLDLPRRRASSRGKTPQPDDPLAHTAPSKKRTSSLGGAVSRSHTDMAAAHRSHSGGMRKSPSPTPHRSQHMVTTSHLRDPGHAHSPRPHLSAVMLQRH